MIDCLGFYSSSCDPINELSWVQRTTWNWNELTVSLNWRHMDGLDAAPDEISGYFEAFHDVDSYDYFDLYASYSLLDDTVTLTIGIDNLTDEDPPVVGNAAGDTDSNSGNTFPSHYDILGTVYKVGFSYRL